MHTIICKIFCALLVVYRLTLLADANDVRLVRGFFEGGESLNLHLHSHAVTLDNGAEIVVKNVQTLQLGYRLDIATMDAMVYLFNSRDVQLCEAHTQVNEKLRGYIKRDQSQYLNSKVSHVLFDESLPIDSKLQHPTVLEIINSKSFLKCYRTVIPFFWIDEWILVIIDTMTYTVHFVHPLYSTGIRDPSTADERCTVNVFLKGIIEAILQTSTGEGYISGKWTFYLSLEENGRATVINSIRTVVYDTEDSGLYVLFAMECDYFDSSMFAPDCIHWSNFRTRMAYCLLNKQLLF